MCHDKHFQRMKSCFGFKACRRFKSTTTPSFFIVKTLRNAKPSHHIKATQDTEYSPLTLFRYKIPSTFCARRNKPTLPQAPAKIPGSKILLDNVKISTPGRFSPFLKNTPHEMQARPSSRQPRQEIYSQRKYFTTPDPFITFNKCFSSPLLFAMFSKQHFLYTQPGQAHQLTSHYV